MVRLRAHFSRPVSAVCLIAFLALITQFCPALGKEADAAADFKKDIQPLLVEHCYDCHGDGARKGGLAFDNLKSAVGSPENRELWGMVLKNVRAGLMPPAKEERLTDAEKLAMARWIKYDAFGLDPVNPDPGRVTLRRLNRVEYRNTVRNLIGIDFRADETFPADDTGHGFDNIGDVLTLSPMLLEKYFAAAKSIVTDTVPVVASVVAEKTILGNQFKREPGDAPAPVAGSGRGGGDGQANDGGLSLSFYDPSTVFSTFTATVDGSYHLNLELALKGSNASKGFDSNRCEVILKADDQELSRTEYGWFEKRELHFDFDQKWKAGEHRITVEVKPLTTGLPRPTGLEVRVLSQTVRGPLEEKYWLPSKNHEKFFGKVLPKTPAEQNAHARELLGSFASRAFRRPIDASTLDRLVALAESIYARPKATFEEGVSYAMVAVLSSPRFIFREEAAADHAAGDPYPLIDEHSLASRLSYFLWSSMPDDELFHLAAAGTLRKNLAAQVKRMLADPRSAAFVENFTGQWLQARDVQGIVIDARKVLDAETLRRVKVQNDRDNLELRQAMRMETEKFFEYVAREDRSVLELLNSDYTFVNERLASYYGLADVKGTEMRRVSLPEASPRGGVLTMGTVLLVTSNPTRTSPVKRGLFILDNILGIPPLPPPPDIPPLEDATGKFKDRTPTLRETLELHRANSVCSSCHNRMDPLGLAMENFNALGLWRDKELDQPIDSAGKLITGEPFKNVQELKRILVANHHEDFYRCLSEKMLTYALGRGLEYYDVEAVDQLVAKLEQNGGHFSALLTGIIESAPFQKRRELQPVQVQERASSAPRTQ